MDGRVKDGRCEDAWKVSYPRMIVDCQVLERDGKVGELDHRADVLQVDLV